jgi:RHS repeat-associated protein
MISTERRVFSRHFIHLSGLLAIVFVGLGYSSTASAQWNIACGSQVFQSGVQCRAPIDTEWDWFANVSLSPHMPSQGELVSALIAREMSITSPPRCSYNMIGFQQDTGGIAYAWPNVLWSDIAHEHVGTFEMVWTSVTPCDVTQQTGIGIYQQRQFFCPYGWTANQWGTDVKCFKDYWRPDFGKSSGSCSVGDVTTPNPCNIGTGNKYLPQTDYVAGGNSPLSVERHYNSNLIVNYPTSQSPFPFGPGWSARYFQRIKYTPYGSAPTATAYRPDGKQLVFEVSGSAFVGAPDVTDALTAQRDLSNVIIGWTYRTAGDVVETYDAGGRLLSITHRGGITETLQYTATSVTVSDNFGHQLVFAIAQNRVTQVTDPAGLAITYQYGTSSTLVGATRQDSTSLQYHYQGLNLTGITDETNTRYTTYTYDGSNHVASTEFAGGVGKYTFTWDTFSRYVTDPAGQTRTYFFDSAAIYGIYRLKASSTVSNTVDAAKTVTYDGNANVSTSKDFNNSQTNYSYDLTRNLETSRTEAFGTSKARTITTAWHSTLRLPTSITEPNRTTAFTYDSNGNVLTRTVTDTSVTPNVSRTWTYTYNTYGQVLTEDGPRTDVSDVTSYTYYSCTAGSQCGQLNTITNALSHATTYNSYNVHGQPTQITDANGLITSLGYDTRQRMADRCVGGALPACSGGELTHFDYWATGLLKKVTNPDGSFVQYIYDAAHRLTEVKDGANNKIVYTLDNAGNRTAENTYDPSLNLRRTHSRVFNTLNQLWKDVNAAGTSNVTTVFGYDSNGNQTTINAPLSRNSTSLYDELNRLIQITDPNSGVTLFGYDANDNLNSIADPRSLVTSYTYTGFGDVKTQTSPDTGLTTHTYDSGGNLASSTDARGAVSAYTYDAMNRVTSAEFTLGGTTDQTVTYSYDGGTNQKGLLTQASDANHTLAWSYDAQGRVTGKGQTVGSITRSIGYGYNGQGQLASIVLPSGKTIQYGYNSNNQVTSVTLLGSPNTTILSGVTYDPFGPVTGWTWGNGTASTSRTFDTDGKITDITSAGQRSFSYDDAFRITATYDIVDANKSWTLGYDILDRLNSATKSGTTIGFTYDANGNRLSQTGTSASAYTVSGTSNKLASTTGSLVRIYTYDAVGNTLTSGDTVHSYNNANRMKTGRLIGGSDTNYIYNALGQRVKKSGGAIATPIYFMYDEAKHLIGEYDSSGNLIQETVWFGDVPVATLRPNGANVDVFYVHTDQLNTPRKVTRPSDNQLRWRWDPTPFGEGIPDENPATLGAFRFDLRFPGQFYDLETNLNYNYFRDYDPALGRYVESDPIGLDGGLNTYRYAGSAPSWRFDPYGLVDANAVGKLIGRRGTDSCTNAIVVAILSGSIDALEIAMECAGGGVPAKATRQLRAICKIQARPPNIPSTWRKEAADKSTDPLKHGFEYVDSGNSHRRVRVMPGNPDSPFPNSQDPYVRVRVDGKFRDINGNPVADDSAASHIPYDEFLNCGCVPGLPK